MKKLFLFLLSALFLRAAYWLLFREGERLEMGATDGYHAIIRKRCELI